MVLTCRTQLVEGKQMRRKRWFLPVKLRHGRVRLVNGVQAQVGEEWPPFRHAGGHEVAQAVHEELGVVSWHTVLQVGHVARVGGVRVVVVCARVAPVGRDATADNAAVAVRRDVLVPVRSSSVS